MDNNALKKPIRKALGRGLSSLISTPAVTVIPSVPGSTIPTIPEDSISDNKDILRSEQATFNEQLKDLLYVDIEKITNNISQPRQNFKETELAELASSITTHGVLQPIIVRPLDDGRFEIVAGERRWRAAKIANLTQVPVIIKKLDDKESYELAIIENVQRDDLNPIEEAKAYQHLADKYSPTQQDISERVGKDRTTITNMMRILRLPQEVIQLIQDKKLSMGHAKAILAVKEPSVQKHLAKKVIAENLSVRKLEEIVARVVVLDDDRRDNHKALNKTSFPEITDRLRKALGTKVIIRHQKNGKGKVELSYFSEDELDRLVEIICLHEAENC